MNIYVGSAGWSLPKKYQTYFPGEGTHLHKYSRKFHAVEINTTFYKSHKDITYRKWSSSVPGDFRFSVKAPREFTHKKKLEDNSVLIGFIDDIKNLGDKLNVILFQLPPALGFEKQVVENFFAELRKRYKGNVVIEPRNVSWLERQPHELFKEFKIARAAVDPPFCDSDHEPGGWDGLVYYRLHGSPKKYYSSYGEQDIKDIAAKLETYSKNSEAWCIFDNTAAGEGVINAIQLSEKLRLKQVG